jgi:HlyD family secretion protein
MPDAPDRSPSSPRTSASDASANGAGSLAPRAGASPGRSHGEGVDRKIEKKTFTPKRLALGAAVLLVVGLVGYLVWDASTGGQRLSVEREKLQVSTVREAPFQEYIAVTGTAIPRRIVYLEAVEGGRVEQVYARSGQMVEKSDPILRLSNNDLRLRLMQNQSRLSEQASRVQGQRFEMEQQRLNLQQQLAQMDYEIQRLEREHTRKKRLFEKDLVSKKEYQQVEDELVYQKRRRTLTRRSFRQDSLAQANRLEQQERSLDRQRQSFGAMQGNLQNLTITAPISGRLTSLDAQVGQIRGAGSSFGQIDDTTGYKVQAQVDEFYIERVQQSQRATTQPIGGQRYDLRVSRVYPEVENGNFRVDLTFTGAAPEGLRRGQTVRLRLELGQPEQSLLVERGGFYQSTGGQWAYVLNGDGQAVRRPIELGRQNPQHFEVLGGLETGDQVVTSSYETFGEADRLVLE